MTDIEEGVRILTELGFKDPFKGKGPNQSRFSEINQSFKKEDPTKQAVVDILPTFEKAFRKKFEE